jgi:hypothetical protein
MMVLLKSAFLMAAKPVVSQTLTNSPASSLSVPAVAFHPLSVRLVTPTSPFWWQSRLVVLH